MQDLPPRPPRRRPAAKTVARVGALLFIPGLVLLGISVVRLKSTTTWTIFIPATAVLIGAGSLVLIYALTLYYAALTRQSPSR